MPLALIIDDHPIVLQGCLETIKAHGACDVLGTSSLADGFRAYRRWRPDIVILDLSFRDNAFAGLTFLRRFRAVDEKTPVLVFSMHDDPTIVRNALHLGANGFVQKDVAPETIGKAYATVIGGEPFLMPEMATRVALLNQPRAKPILDQLSTREIEILGLISRGHAYADVAAHLGISYKTVANTASGLKSKLAARSLPELVVKALQLLH